MRWSNRAEIVQSLFPRGEFSDLGVSILRNSMVNWMNDAGLILFSVGKFSSPWELAPGVTLEHARRAAKLYLTA